MIKRAAGGAAPSKETPKQQLAKYRAKRDFKITPEPSGDAKKSGRARKEQKLEYVIQKHAASHLHYDFRLELDGVLKSWAVTKGPSYYPGDKRLAVQVEDHPLEYGGFEGIIPKGQYGGGTVMLWDRGTWEPVGDAHEGLRKGDLKFILHGEKLHGRWVLVRMGGKYANEAKPNWLLIKEHDGEEHSPDATPITEEEPNSVASGRDMEEIARARDAVWNSNADPPGNGLKRSSTKSARSTGPAKTKPTTTEPAARPSQSKSLANLASRLAHLPKEALPVFVSPMLATMGENPPKGKDWVHEIKLDGYRTQARVQVGGRAAVRLLTRTGLDWTHRMRSVAAAVANLPVTSAVFDGEVVVLDSDGMSSFANLQAAFQEGARFPLTYFVFDLLHLDGRNLRGLPLLERKEILAQVLSGTPAGGPIRISEHMEGDAKTVFDGACRLGLEGIISKFATGKYVSGRSTSWLKLKCYREQEFVIGGFTLPSNGIRGVGALLLGVYKNGKLLYAGRTGTGFTQKTHRMLRDKLESIRSESSPFAGVPAEVLRGVHWVKPQLVAQVSFSNWTADNLVRQAAFKGLREDKPAKSVQREEAQPVRENRKAASKPASEQKLQSDSQARTCQAGARAGVCRAAHPPHPS